MREYARVAPTFWTRGSGKKLRGDADAQLVALYLLTSPASTMIGIYYLSIPTLVHETGLTTERARAAMAKVEDANIAFYDEDAELVFLPEGAKYQVGHELRTGDNRIKGIERDLSAFGNHPFVLKFIDRYRYCFSLSIEEVRQHTFQAPSKGETRGPATPIKPGSGSGTSSGSGSGQANTSANAASEPSGSGSCGLDTYANPDQPADEPSADGSPNGPASQEPKEPTGDDSDDPTGAPAPANAALPHPCATASHPKAPPMTLFAPEAIAPTIDPAAEVFDAYLAGWRRVVKGGRPPELMDKRRELVRRRLRDGFLVEDLKRACDGLWRCPWNIEKKYTSFELVMRDAEHVERFMGWAYSLASTGVTAEAIAEAYAAGQTDASGARFAAPVLSMQFEAVLSEHAIDAVGAPLRGNALLSWIRASSAEYRRARADAATFENGFSPSKWAEWIQAGKPSARTICKPSLKQPANGMPANVVRASQAELDAMGDVG